VSTEPGINVWEGMWFHFEIDGDQVSVHGSAWSGAEKVWVNDNLVSETRTLTSLASVHYIRVGERDLEVHLRTADILRGSYEVEICHAGERLRYSRLSYIPDDQSTGRFLLMHSWPSWKLLLPAWVVGAIVGILSGYYRWW